MPRPGGPTDKANSIGNSAPYVATVARNLKEIPNYPAKGKVTNTKSKDGLSGRCPGAVNVNIGPVQVTSYFQEK